MRRAPSRSSTGAWTTRRNASNREQAYEETYLTPWPASERGLVDEVIDPADTRIALTTALRQLATKRELVVGRKHEAGPQ